MVTSTPPRASTRNRDSLTAAGCYLSGSLLIAAEPVGILAAGRPGRPAHRMRALTRPLSHAGIQAGQTRCGLYLQPAPGRWLCPVLKLAGA
jgi:hypothetical protein